jgi:hypothetical protein
MLRASRQDVLKEQYTRGTRTKISSRPVTGIALPFTLVCRVYALYNTRRCYKAERVWGGGGKVILVAVLLRYKVHVLYETGYVTP